MIKELNINIIIQMNLIKFYPDDVLRAINKINPNKAISWEYITNKIISIIKSKKDLNNINNLTKFYNILFNPNNTITYKIITSRLFCLNKDAL